MRKKVGLKDIANRVGVSTTLVSYVLNNRMESRINKGTAEKIRKAAREMNYRPNQIAKSLKNNKTQSIGLIVADIANPFSSSIARMIEDEAEKNNFTVIFGSADESASKAEGLINVLLSRQVDGFIIAPPVGLEKQLRRLQEEGVPFILIDRYFKDFNFPYITIDNYETSFNATKHLLNNGFRNIGFINYQTSLTHLLERTQGYLDALVDSASQKLIEIDESNLKTAIQRAIDSLLNQKEPVDALFFSSSNVAIEGLAYLRRLNIKVPEEMGVICFDETVAYELFQYPVTFIRQPLKKMGRKAVQLLLEDINGVRKVQKIILKTEMIIKESSQK